MSSLLKPFEQQKSFFDWFNIIGVETFDIHVRKPKTSCEDYKTGDWFWLTNNENITAEYIKKKLLSWIRYENTKGSDIYFRPHKEGIHPVIFLDDIPIDKALKVAKKYTACVIETSSGNTQVWLATNKPLDKNFRKAAQSILKDLGYSDPGSISGDHLGRLCGVQSRKHNTWVNLLKTSKIKPWTPNFAKSNSLPPAPKHQPMFIKTVNFVSSNTVNITIGGACGSKKLDSITIYDTSDSAREWGWVLGMLENGLDPAMVTKKLVQAATQRGKRNPERYAKYTVKKALRAKKFNRI